MIKQHLKTIISALETKLFIILDFFAQKGNKTAHKLACLMLPY